MTSPLSTTIGSCPRKAATLQCTPSLTNKSVPNPPQAVSHSSLTSPKLMAISEAQCVLDPRHAIQNRLPWDDRDRPRNLPLSRRRSFCAPLESGMEALISQMAHTLNYPGWKPNLRSHSIHGPFLSMEEMFYSLPEEVPIHVEISTSTQSSSKGPSNLLLQNIPCCQRHPTSRWTASPQKSTTLPTPSSPSSTPTLTPAP